MKKKKSAAIVPVPVGAPPAPRRHPQLGPIGVRYGYHNAGGELVLYVCRFEPNSTWEASHANAPKGTVEKPDHKTFRPLSFCKFEDGSTRWSWVAPETDIPLYRANKLAANPTAKVIVCEGEKAVRAAQHLFPDRVAITGLGGAKAVHKASWAALARRELANPVRVSRTCTMSYCRTCGVGSAPMSVPFTSFDRLQWGLIAAPGTTELTAASRR